MLTYFLTISSSVFLCFLATLCGRTRVSEDDISLKPKQIFDTRLFLFLAIAILVFVAGCRYRVGTDYKAYMDLYEQYISTPWNELLTWDEPIFPIIGKICGIWSESSFPMFFVASLLTIGLALYSMYKETVDFTFVTILFIFLGCWHGTFNGIRQYLAVTIVFLGRPFIYNRKFFRFVLICLLAFLVHKSAIFFILIYFLASKEITVKRLIAVIAITVAVSLSYESIFEFIGWMNDSEFILNEYSTRAVSIFRVLVGCCPAALGIYFAYTKKLNEKQIFNVYMLVANAAVRVATSGSAYLARLGAYTALFVPLALSSVMESCDKKYKWAFKVGIIVLYGLYWYYEIVNSATLYYFEWIFGNL